MKSRQAKTQKINVIRSPDKPPKLKAVPKLLKLNLGAGQRKFEDFLSVDSIKTAITDRVVDLFKFPWPWKNESVSDVYAAHFFEHVPKELRPKFMDEVWRILVPGGKAVFITPYWSSMRAIQDPTHEWPPICETSFLYFNRNWVNLNGLSHAHRYNCDFDFVYGHGVSPNFMQKNDETRQFASAHYVNAVDDGMVTLTKRVLTPWADLPSVEQAYVKN